MSVQQKELAAFVGKVKAYVDRQRVKEPHARVRTSAPLKSSAKAKEAEITKALSQVPVLAKLAPVPQQQKVQVVFVSLKLLPKESPAGKLLAKIIQAMGLQPSDAAYGDPSGLAALLPLAQPKALVALGEATAKAMLGGDERWDRLRGRFAQFQGLPLMPTHHPEELLEQEALKRHVWEDMKQLAARLKD